MRACGSSPNSLTCIGACLLREIALSLLAVPFDGIYCPYSFFASVDFLSQHFPSQLSLSFADLISRAFTGTLHFISPLLSVDMALRPLLIHFTRR